MPEEALRLVQFVHPGGEHRPDRDAPGMKRWNEGDHGRKFMRAPGRWLEGSRTRNGPIVFWGEWEPPSEVEELDRPSPDYPRYLHRPYLEARTRFGKHQNTDPFVFGDRFLYTGCQQWRGGYPVQLRFLQRGSIVLFGSPSRGRFLLDTVLVVRDYIDHDKAVHKTVLRDRVPDAYWTGTLGPWYAGPDEGRSWRLYRGASRNERVHGMFSFFPCLPVDQVVTEGFARPDISGVRGVNPRLLQGWKATKLAGLDDAESVWRTVKETVLRQDCELGVRAELPPLR